MAKSEISLKSEKGVDYTKLCDLLAAGKWELADLETGSLMCQCVGREREGWLREEDIDNFPCEDLRTINQLWLHYSNGRFGFSVQQKIYEDTCENYEEVWARFCDRVGWRNEKKARGYSKWLDYSDLTFNLNAQRGHLPAVGYISTYEQFFQSDYGIGGYERCTEGLMVDFYELFFYRTNTCNPIGQ